MNDFQRRAQYRMAVKKERILTILARTPYTEQSALYHKAKKELMALSDDVILLLAQQVRKA